MSTSVWILARNIHNFAQDDKKGRLSKVTAGDIEDCSTFKVASGLSPNSVIKHHAIIRTALQWAVSHRYIRENVADFAKKPERIRYHGAPPYSVEEVATLLQLTQHDSIAVPIFLACFYGLRRSEILGLRWSSIDFVKGTLCIETTVVKEKHGDTILTVIRDNVTKTDSSYRTLPLCPYTFQYFSNLYQFQRQQQLLCGSSYDTSYLDFVCVNVMGTLLQPDHVSQAFQSLLAKACLQKLACKSLLAKYSLRAIRFHDLRHSCATIMLTEADRYLKTMSSRMKNMNLTCAPFKIFIKENSTRDQLRIEYTEIVGETNVQH